VDASVIPAVPSGNTQAPIMMIAERACDLIKAAHGLKQMELAAANKYIAGNNLASCRSADTVREKQNLDD
jgi:choline dehydrogenase